MVALLGPILAQLATLSVADRTEAREIVGLDTRAEASTRPLASLGLVWKHASLTLNYSPSFTLTPLGTRSRPQLLVFQAGSLGGTYRLGRTLLYVGQSAGYGDQNFESQALADGRLPAVGGTTAPNTGPPPVTIGTVLGGPTTPNGGGANAPGSTAAQSQNFAFTQIVRFETFATTVAVSHTESSHVAYGADAGYTISGAVHPSDQQLYPLVRGPRSSAFFRYGWGHGDTVTSMLAVQYSVGTVQSDPQLRLSGAATEQSVWLGALTETWVHRFSLRTAALLGAGLSVTRSPVVDDGTVVAYSFYPTLNAGLTHTEVVERGLLSLGVNVASAPAVDLVTLAVDPRISVGGAAGYARDRFFSSLSGGSTVSVAESQSTALQTAAGALTVGYVLGKAVSIDTGLRVAWQSYGGTTYVPFTYAGFVGVSVALATPLR